MYQLDTPLVGNSLLDTLPSSEARALLADADRVFLSPRDTLYLPDQPIGSLYFVLSGVVTILATLESGHSAEIGIIGHEGMVGLPLVAGMASSPHGAFVLVAGTALRIRSEPFRRDLARSAVLQRTMLRYLQTCYGEVSQTAVCNGHHSLVQRLAKDLLLTYDRIEGDELDITHELLSAMVGAHRPGVSIAARNLQTDGIIDYRRGKIRVLDRSRLKNAACECYDRMRPRFGP